MLLSTHPPETVGAQTQIVVLDQQKLSFKTGDEQSGDARIRSCPAHRRVPFCKDQLRDGVLKLICATSRGSSNRGFALIGNKAAGKTSVSILDDRAGICSKRSRWLQSHGPGICVPNDAYPKTFGFQRCRTSKQVIGIAHTAHNFIQVCEPS